MPQQIELDLSLQKRTIEQGFTQSELSVMDECSLKWNFIYNNLLVKSGKMNWALWVGSAWHQFQQSWRKYTGDIDLTTHFGNESFDKEIVRDADFEQQFEYWSGVLPAYQQVYAKLYKGEEKWDYLLIEEELSAEFMGFKIRGKIDLASDKFKFIRDFKTTSSAWLTSPNGWHFKLQFMMYAWLMSKNYPKFTEKQFDFQLDIMQKPGLKQTQADGTLVGHIRRVCGDIQKRPEFYFTRTTQMILPEHIKRFEQHVLGPKIEKLALVQENPEAARSIIENPNTNACNMFGNQCDFFEICSQGWDVGKFFFTQRNQKHQEL